MLKKTQQIKFISTHPLLDVPAPTPAVKAVPDSYRKMPSVIEGGMTVKKCVPFLDALTSGYTFYSSADVDYEFGKGFQQFAVVPTVSMHGKKQLEGVEITPEFDTQPYKWENLFVARTPKGYSTMFVHPMNRLELPFFTLGGIVDTDLHDVPVNFPFLMKKDFKGTIPAGTPLIQAIPFKREDWKHSVDATHGHTPSMNLSEMHNPPFGFYKKHWWERKSFR